MTTQKNSNVRSNVIEITKTFDNSIGHLEVLKKKLENVKTTMVSYASKTNVGIYGQLAGQMEAYKEEIDRVVRSTRLLQEETEAHHRLQSNAADADLF